MSEYVVKSKELGVQLSPIRETAELAERDRRCLARPEAAEVVEVRRTGQLRVAPCLGRPRDGEAA